MISFLFRDGWNILWILAIAVVVAAIVGAPASRNGVIAMFNWLIAIPIVELFERNRAATVVGLVLLLPVVPLITAFCHWALSAPPRPHRKIIPARIDPTYALDL